MTTPAALADQVGFKSLLATVKAVDGEHPNGEFEAVLSTTTLDREGESVATKAFDPLPSTIPVYHQHDWVEKALPIGRGVPSYDDDGALRVKGVYASTPAAQEIRTLVNEGVIDSMSVGFINGKRKALGGGKHEVTTGELLEASFTAVPVNSEALVLASKALAEGKAGKRNSASDLAVIQDIHDMTAGIGATCDGASPGSEGAGKSLRRSSDLKAVEGSYEARQEDLLEALVEANAAELALLYPDYGPGEMSWRVNIIATFEDRVVYSLEYGNDDAYQVSYTYDGETVTLGTPSTVEVNQVVSISSEADDSTSKSVDPEAAEIELRKRALRLRDLVA